MISQLRPALLVFAAMTALTGLIYPLLVTAAARLLFPHQAHGSLIRVDGRLLGSELIGRWFDDPKYFWPRPSATSPHPYNSAASAGSNLGPLSDLLAKAKRDRETRLREADPGNPAPPPAELLTASGSGLDPHISPGAAFYQVARVARSRGVDPSRVRQVVEAAIEPPQLGFLGESRVNVLKMNLALDNQK